MLISKQMAMQDSCIHYEAVVQEKRQQKRRRSSIFKPNDCKLAFPSFIAFSIDHNSSDRPRRCKHISTRIQGQINKRICPVAQSIR